MHAGAWKIENTTLLRAVLALAAGVLMGPAAAPYCTPGMCALAIIVWACVFAVTAWNARRAGGACVLEAWCVAGCVMAGIAVTVEQREQPGLPARAEAWVHGRVASDVVWQARSGIAGDSNAVFASFPLMVDEIVTETAFISGLAERVWCIVTAAQPLGFARGDTLAVSGSWQRIRGASNPGQFDTAAYFARSGIRHRLAADAVVHWEQPAWMTRMLRLQRGLDRRRAAFAAMMTRPGCEDECAVMRCMLLGLQQGLPDDVVEAFKRTNTFHVLSISGLHIGVVWSVWWCIAWAAGVPGTWRGAAALPALWLYGGMVGMRASVVRSLLMFTLFSLAPLVRRQHDAFHTLVVAAFCYILLWPRQLACPATQLTFLAVAALLAGTPVLRAIAVRLSVVRAIPEYDIEHQRMRWLQRIKHYALNIMLGTLSVWAVTWPITVMQNHLVTPLSWLANLVIVPFTSVVLVTGVATLALSFVSYWLAGIVFAANTAVLRALMCLVEVMSALPGSHAVTRSLTAGGLLWYYFTVVVTWCWLQRHAAGPATVETRRRGLAALAAWVVFAKIMAAHDGPACTGLQMTALDVGLGDAMVLREPSGATILTDGGTALGPWSMGARVVVPYLRSEGIGTLDAVVCTHADRDHAAGLIDVLRLMRVRELLLPPVGTNAPLFDVLAKCAGARGVPVRTWSAGETNTWGLLRGIAVSPASAIADEPARAAAWGGNMWSLVVRWECRGRSVLAAGDAPTGAEAAAIADGRIARCDVLKVAHHGSAGSTSARFIDVARPAAAVLSVGPGMPGLPAPQVIDALAAADARVIRTDASGAVRLEMQTNALAVSVFGTGCID